MCETVNNYTAEVKALREEAETAECAHLIKVGTGVVIDFHGLRQTGILQNKQ